MDSIAPARGHWQPVRDKNHEVFPSGIRLHRNTGYVFVGDHLSGEDKVKRGKICGFTAGARRRLRAALLEMSIPRADRFGLTLTVPWKGTDFSGLMDEFRECHHRFEQAFALRFPASGYIFRVELQQRGAPHIHALVYLAPQDLARACAHAPVAGAADRAVVLACAGFEMREMWTTSVHDLHHGSLGAFWRRGAVLEDLASTGAMLRYICDHTSKRKQAQLGYQGKQWGIVSKANFVKAQPIPLPPPQTERHWWVFLRMLRKVMRYRITDQRHRWKRKPPFGSVLRGSKRAVGDFFLDGAEVLRIFNAAATIARPDIVPRGTNVKQSV